MYRLQRLRNEEIELRVAMATYDIAMDRNAILHERLRKIVAEHQREHDKREEHRESVKQSQFDTRIALDQVLRKTIDTFDNNYKFQAVRTCTN